MLLTVKEKAIHEKDLVAPGTLGRACRVDDGRWMG
jgi:hypothetical protein